MAGGGPDPGHCELHTFRLLQGQLSPAPRGTYRDCLGRLDLQYAKLLVSGGQEAWGGGQAGGGGLGSGLWPADRAPACLQNSSKARLRSLESLHGFVAAATKELMWLSEKEEEEVGFDWGEHNSNMAAKKESYSVRLPCPVGPWALAGPPAGALGVHMGGWWAWRGPDAIPETHCLCVRL